MNNVYGAFLDNYHYIKLFVPKYEYLDLDHMCLIDNNNELPIICDEIKSIDDIVFCKILTTYELKTHVDYYLRINDKVKYHVQLGDITRIPEFDRFNFLDSWLGVKYDENGITFRVWSPVAKELILVLNDTDEYRLTYQNCGLYEVSIINKNEQYDGARYYYKVRINEDFKRTIDPYGTTISPDYQYCFVTNPNKAYQMKTSFVNYGKEKIIYEMNIRDFTNSLPVCHHGEFLGIVESKKIDNHGLDYLHRLGITHVQLMPIFAFGAVNYTVKDPGNKDFKYNWGYNPILYNALSGWYVSNPNDPYAQINEFRQMIDAFHQEGIAVNMDVVYNHVYESENYCMEILVPGYMFRVFDNGKKSDGSWCGNDVASERLMVRKFIIDSVKYYQDFYHIDGFRFDLMGLIDIETMNSVYDNLVKNNKKCMVYGEGWQMNTAYPNTLLTTLVNTIQTPNLSFFNDFYRNTIKGKNDFSEDSIFSGLKYSQQLIESLFSGGMKGNKLFTNENQSINYVECHDNYTFYDQQIIRGIDKNIAKENAKLALFFILFSKGIPFIHSGQEMLRSKYRYDNSYNLPDFVNQMPWYLLINNGDVIEYVKTLIKIRKEFNFSDYSFCSVSLEYPIIKVSFKKEEEILNLIINLSVTKINVVFNKKTILIFDGNEIINKHVNGLLLDRKAIITLTN